MYPQRKFLKIGTIHKSTEAKLTKRLLTNIMFIKRCSVFSILNIEAMVSNSK